MQQMLLRHRKEWERALAADLGKSHFDSWTTEISQVTAEISHVRKHLRSWMKPQAQKTPLALKPAKSYVRHDPYGTVVIIAPWNYPLQLLLSPMVGAIAGGNCIVLKPSEVSTNVERLFQRLVPRYFDPSAIRVVTGGPDVVNMLIDAKPDLVFFTGSTQVGTLIRERCARELTPCILELGGKSPVYVHKDANLSRAAERIVWGKYLNAGQTCVAPDHVYVHRSIANRFARAVKREIHKQFGKKPWKSRDYGRIINSRHTDRIARLISDVAGTKVYSGGAVDRENRYIAPTILFPASEQHPAMAEEIFGPVLPILPVSSPDEAVERITQRAKPLSFYIFTNKKRVQEQLLRSVQSGGVAINATVIQLSSPLMPFGGVGESGEGNYHGRWSFLAFTHERAVVEKPYCPNTFGVITPPTGAASRLITTKLLLRGGKAPRRDVKLAKKLRRKGLRR
jgi:aldehyde dehydrogenase (NAD+)